MTTPTPFELGLKGVHPALRPRATIWGISRRNGECQDSGTNKLWAADLIAAERPEIAHPIRRLYLAHGIDLLGGHISRLRPVRVRRPAGFASYLLDPVRGWRREGATAGPRGRLP